MWRPTTSAGTAGIASVVLALVLTGAATAGAQTSTSFGSPTESTSGAATSSTDPDGDGTTSSTSAPSSGGTTSTTFDDGTPSTSTTTSTSTTSSTTTTSTSSTTTTTPPSTSTTARSVFYADCSDARAQGANLPLIPGDPGWRPGLDPLSVYSVAMCDPATTTTALRITTTVLPPTVPITAPSGTVASSGAQGAQVYANCAEVRAAGRAPLSRGSAGYRAGLDGDGDGLACEDNDVLPATGGGAGMVVPGALLVAGGLALVVLVRRREGLDGATAV